MAVKPSLELRLRLLSAVDYAPGDSIRECIGLDALSHHNTAQT